MWILVCISHVQDNVVGHVCLHVSLRPGDYSHLFADAFMLRQMATVMAFLSVYLLSFSILFSLRA